MLADSFLLTFRPEQTSSPSSDMQSMYSCLNAANDSGMAATSYKHVFIDKSNQNYKFTKTTY